MKIKSVEISAFRIYDNPKEATFDFTDKQGSIANFVGLYAPNGFGKTSFYDAVEWGITNSIQRFYIRNTEMDILAHSQSSYNDISLLKNSNSSRDTFVKIVMDTEEKEQTLPKKRNQKSDLNFRQPKVHDFQQVILSQEWISAFLTEKNGVERLKKFMEKPDLAPIYSYFRKLIIQIGVLKTKKEKLQEDIDKYQKQFINNTQDNLLDKINSQIDLLASKFNQSNLFPIQLSTTKEEVKNLRDIITERLSSQNKIPEIQSKLDDLFIAKSGSKEMIGIEQFFKYKAALGDLSIKISEIRDRIRQFDNLEKNTNSLLQLKSTLGSLQNQKQECDVVSDIFEDYKEINEEILKRIADIFTNEEQLKPIQVQASALNQEEVELNVQLESILSQLSELSNNIAAFPSIKERINSSNDKIINLKESISSFPESKANIEENINQLRRVIGDIQELIDNIKNQRYSTQSVIEIPNLVAIINVIEGNIEKLTSKKEALLVLNERIESQKQLNSSLQNFVEIGLKLAAERQSSLCPLCEQDYGTYLELAQKISKNTGLTKLLQDLLGEKSDLLSEINTLENEISENNKILITFYNELKDESLQLVKVQEEKLSQLTNAYNDRNNELQQQQELLSELNKFLGGNDIDEFESILSKKIDDLTKSKETLSEKLTKVRLRIKEFNDNKSIILNKVELYKNEIEALEQNEKYNKVISWFNTTLFTQNIEREYLYSKKTALSRQIEDLVTQIKLAENKILQLSQSLAELNLEVLKKQNNDNEKKLIELQQSVNSYKAFLIERFQINPDNYDFLTLLDAIGQKNNEEATKLETNRKLIQEYEKLQSYSINVEGFLQSEDVKYRLKKLNEDLNFLRNNVEPLLKREKENTKNYLNERVRDFFYEKLINELYKKIDPHPDFKSVKFQPDFESDNPRLDVFVKNNTDETMLIPNLYFSTAQINILSLSIFLASALNSKKYDCIFIDDPIQSMDSINVLSTIDLLRSIALSYDKQIILSTHDENFHNLLKKKMPPNLFKSKFLELESFGKLKATSLE